MTDLLGSACPYQPTELLRSTLAMMGGDAETSNALCRLVLAGGARGGGQDPPRPRARMLALWNLGVGVSVLGRLAEAEDCTRQALTLALEIGELSLAADLGANLVGFAAERDGRSVHARNFLRWFDLPRHDSVLSGCSRLVDPAAWIAADLGRHGDAARLARVVGAAPLFGIVFNPGETPDDLLDLLRRVAPAAVEEAFRDELLGPADSLALARDVMNDPGLPPQADPAEGATAPPPPSPPEVVPRSTLIGPLGVLPPEACDQVASAGRLVHLGRGEFLSDSQAHLILSGWVGYQMVTPAGETATVDVAGVGELVGDPSPLPGRLAEVVAVTLGPVEAVAVAAALIVELRRRYPLFQEALMDLLVARVRRLAVTVTDALYLPVEPRVASRLADLAGRAGPGVPVALSITQDELATMVGSTRPTISRVLTKMEAAGAVRRARGRIHVLDPEALRP